MTEERIREIFRVAREVAAEDLEVLTVLFFLDEIDSLGLDARRVYPPHR